MPTTTARKAPAKRKTSSKKVTSPKTVSSASTNGKRKKGPRKVQNVKKRDTALAKTKALAEIRKKAEAQAIKDRNKLFDYLDPAFEAGCTYRELAQICEMTTVRIAQILQDRRNS